MLEALLQDPPYDLRWLPKHASLALLQECILDPAVDAGQRLGGLNLTDDHLSAVLALRGMLSYGLLQHCLIRRHSVDYGVNR